MKFKTKRKVLDGFIKHRNYLEKGLSLMYWVIKLGQFFVLGEVYFKLVIPEQGITTFTVFAGVCLFLVLMWFVGMFWDRHKLYHIENEFNNRRNKFVEEMRKKIK